MTRILWGSVVTLCAFLASCSNQEEGERCDLANGNADCESGLECRSVQSLRGAGNAAICCPADDGASVAACSLDSFDFDGDDEAEDDTADDAAEDEVDAAADDMSADMDASPPEEPPPSDSGTGGAAPTPDAATPAPDAAADSGSDAG